MRIDNFCVNSACCKSAIGQRCKVHASTTVAPYMKVSTALHSLFLNVLNQYFSCSSALSVCHLQRMLEKRDWTALQGARVDRRGASIEYYRTAQKLQALTADAAAATAAAVEREVAAAEAALGAPSAAALSAAARAGGGYRRAGDGSSADFMGSDSGDSSVGYDGMDGSSAVDTAVVRPPQVISTMPAVAQLSSEYRPPVTTTPPPSSQGSTDDQSPAATDVAASAADTEDIKKVATVLMKRLMTKRPVTRGEYEDMDAAVERLLQAQDVL